MGKQTKKVKTKRVAMTIDEVINVLTNPDVALNASVIYSLSDLSSDALARLEAIWPTLSIERHLQLVQRLGEVSETNFDTDFSRVMRLAINDPDPGVRQAGIESIWYDESPELLRALLRIAQNDPVVSVRAQALVAIGRFILLGELDEFNEVDTRRAQEVALAIYRNDDEEIDVRRRAIEALGNCSRPEVAELIQEAYDSDNLKMRVSAVFAMGRSCDKAWADTVLEELDSDQPELRYEAVRAAGELELHQAVPQLAELLGESDREVREMAVW